MFTGLKISLAALLLAVSSVAIGQTTSSAASNNSNNKTAEDERFINEAGASNYAEIEMGKMALKNSSSDQVKRFAQRVIDDRTRENLKLQDIAKCEGISISDHLNSMETQQKATLAQRTGARFDDQYANYVSADEAKDVATYTKAEKQITNSDLKNYVSETLPVIRNERQIAQNIGPIETQANAK